MRPLPFAHGSERHHHYDGMAVNTSRLPAKTPTRADGLDQVSDRRRCLSVDAGRSSGMRPLRSRRWTNCSPPGDGDTQALQNPTKRRLTPARDSFEISWGAHRDPFDVLDHLPLDVFEHRPEQSAFVAVMVVDRTLCDRRRSPDRVERGMFVAVLGKTPRAARSKAACVSADHSAFVLERFGGDTYGRTRGRLRLAGRLAADSSPAAIRSRRFSSADSEVQWTPRKAASSE